MLWVGPRVDPNPLPWPFPAELKQPWAGAALQARSTVLLQGELRTIKLHGMSVRVEVCEDGTTQIVGQRAGDIPGSQIG